jgi:CPA1 family monovalent cation:H+ antiporter
MDHAQLFVVLLVAVVLVALLARRWRLPESVALVAGGLGFGALPFAPEVHLEPDVIFLAFLPPILYPAAYEYASEDVRANLRPIGFLAIGLVLATMAAIAVVLHVVAGIPWAPAFVAGAILSPTDPVAATTTIRSAGAPDRLATILEGESLINDGTALTALRIAVAAVGAATFEPASAILEFVTVALGGAAIGGVLGWLTSQLRRHLDDLYLESSIAVLLAYGSFVVAEAAGTSGILATVLAGYMMGRASGDVMSAETRSGGIAFWGVARFLGESILFLLVGLAFAQVLDNHETGRSALELAGLIALVSAVALGIRFLWMATVPLLAGVLHRRDHGLQALIGGRERTVIAFGGMRGAVSVVAALSIPQAVGGTPFPDRDALIVVALGTIIVLLVVPALGLPPLLRRLGLTGGSEQAERERTARAALARAALARMADVEGREDIPDEVMRRIRERYEWRVAHEKPDGRKNGRSREFARAYRDLRRELLDAERQALAELRERGEITGEGLRSIERDLDLEETRIA